MKMESKIDQNNDYFFEIYIVPDSKFKISTFIFRKLHSRCSDFLFSKKKILSCQIVVCFPGLDTPGLNRIGLKMDMRNDNLFFKRVSDLIISDYPLSIDM